MTRNVPDSPSRKLVVSIHDVSPLTLEPVRKLRAQLHHWGVNQCSLLVIPNHHKKGRTVDSPETLSWIKDALTSGDEVVLHGYYHQRVSPAANNPWEYLIANYYTAGEGEFQTLDYQGALQSLKQGDAEFHSAGFPPRGFIAPAWLCGKQAWAALRTHGFAYTTTLGAIHDLKSEKEISTQSLVWSVRSGWRRQMSLAWNQWLYSRNHSKEILRISLHPPDMLYPKIWSQIETLVKIALKDRKATTYLDCLSQ